jgi:hypothetical protein
VLLAAVVVVNTPRRVALLQPQDQHKPQAQHKQHKQKNASVFSQPGYNPQHPQGIWGKGVPPEFVDEDYKLVKSLADVEQDLNQDTALMGQSQVAMGHAPTKLPTARGQQLAVGGVDIEGGQGESDSIFGSHDDHSTYGVAGSGWQAGQRGDAGRERERERVCVYYIIYRATRSVSSVEASSMITHVKSQYLCRLRLKMALSIH